MKYKMFIPELVKTTFYSWKEEKSAQYNQNAKISRWKEPNFSKWQTLNHMLRYPLVLQTNNYKILQFPAQRLTNFLQPYDRIQRLYPCKTCCGLWSYKWSKFIIASILSIRILIFRIASQKHKFKNQRKMYEEVFSPWKFKLSHFLQCKQFVNSNY